MTGPSSVAGLAMIAAGAIYTLPPSFRPPAPQPAPDAVDGDAQGYWYVADLDIRADPTGRHRAGRRVHITGPAMDPLELDVDTARRIARALLAAADYTEGGSDRG